MYDTIRVTSGPWRTLISLVTSFTLPILPLTKGRLLPSLHAYELCVCVCTICLCICLLSIAGNEHETWFMRSIFHYICIYESVCKAVAAVGIMCITKGLIIL